MGSFTARLLHLYKLISNSEDYKTRTIFYLLVVFRLLEVAEHKYLRFDAGDLSAGIFLRRAKDSALTMCHHFLLDTHKFLACRYNKNSIVPDVVLPVFLIYQLLAGLLNENTCRFLELQL